MRKLRTRCRRALTLLARPAALLGGIYLAGLPTYYALFTVGDTGTSASDARKPSLLLFIIWIAIALVVGYLTLLKDTEILAILRRSKRKLRHDRTYDTFLHAIELLLKDPRFAMLRAFKPTIFICDDRHRPTELVPLDNEYPAAWERWPIGHGAVGAAFEASKEKVLFFRGEDLEQLNRSLTADQMREYGELKLIATYPLRGSDERPLGVLSVSSLKDKGFADKRIDKLKLLGSELGVLVDLIL